MDINVFLDYMDNEDITKLAVKALKDGKNIEAYLDYLDENVSNLLVQLTDY